MQRMTSTPGAGTEIPAAELKIQYAGDPRRRATRRSSPAICNASLQRKRHVRKSADAFQPLQWPYNMVVSGRPQTAANEYLGHISATCAAPMEILGSSPVIRERVVP